MKPAVALRAKRCPGLLIPAACIAGLAAAASIWHAGATLRAEPQRRTPRVVLLSVDGGADWIVDRLVADGKAPAFAALARAGARAEALISTLPSLTAPAHAALWTGTSPLFNGVTGNEVVRRPRSAHTVLEKESGFSSSVLQAEPIWIAAARAGLSVLVPQATGGFPFTNQYPDRVLQFDTYSSRLLDEDLIEGRLAAGRYEYTIGDTNVVLTGDARGGLTLRAGAEETRLIPGSGGRFSPPVPVQVSGRRVAARFRLIRFLPETGEFALFRGVATEITASDPGQLAAFSAAAGALVGEGAGRFYRQGRFGPPLAQGGNGEAERWLSLILRANQEYFDGALAYAGTRPWSLLVLYTPNLDAAGHPLGGLIDPDNPNVPPAIAARAWSALEQLFLDTVDTYVAEIRRRFPDAVLIVTSDHGMEGAWRQVLPNVALRQAGLLALDARGEIDLSRTLAIHHSGNGGAIFINSVDRKGGIVRETEKAGAKRQIAAALLGLRDPETGAPVVRAVFDAEIDGLALGIGGPSAGDLYFDLAPGYSASDRRTGDRIVVDRGPGGAGEHGLAPWRRRLHAIFYAAGPGISPGQQLGIVRSIDVAPTVARLLGIPRPRNATGQAIPMDGLRD